MALHKHPYRSEMIVLSNKDKRLFAFIGEKEVKTLSAFKTHWVDCMRGEKGRDYMNRRIKQLTSFEIELIQSQVDAIRQEFREYRKEFKEERKESEARLAIDRKEAEARQQATETRLVAERKEAEARQQATEARLALERKESIERLKRERKDARSTRRWLITNFVAIMVLLISGLITFFTLING